MLGKTIANEKWLALLLLAIGVALVQLFPPTEGDFGSEPPSVDDSSADHEPRRLSQRSVPSGIRLHRRGANEREEANTENGWPSWQKWGDMARQIWETEKSQEVDGIAPKEIDPVKVWEQRSKDALPDSATPEKSNSGNAHRNAGVGFFAILASCLSSGYAGVYFERLLKHGSHPVITVANPMVSHVRVPDSMRLWIRNIQLGLFGLLFSMCACIFTASSIIERGFLAGYDSLVWMVILNQAVGGLVVAVAVKYADNVLKGFATSVSIIVSGIWMILVNSFVPNATFLIGTAVVIASVFLYSRPDPMVIRKDTRT